MQMSSIDENIPEDAGWAVLEPPNLKRGPVGAMCPVCVTYACQESFQPFAIPL